MPRRGVGALAVLSAATLAACGGSKGMNRTEAPGAKFVRDCATHVEGGLPRDWRRRSVEVGPVAFYPARTFEDEANPDPGAKFVGEKALVVLRARDDVTVVVGQRQRDSASLDYEYGTGRKRRSPPVNLSDGVGVVRFVACRGGERPLSPGHRLDRETQFNGGIVGRWGQCVPLDVFVRGRDTPLRAAISLGAGRCR